MLLVKKELNDRKITLRENESASLGTPDTRADSSLFFGRDIPQCPCVWGTGGPDLS